ncbi:MAG: cobalamin-binding protein, partial [Desulfatiglandales bacterium]
MRADDIYYDPIGRKVVLNGVPQRIVSFAPSITEILYFLGLGDRVVGVTEYSYYPPEAQKKPKIGSYININLEKVLTLNPDLVIATKDGNPPQTVELLDGYNIPVYVINPRTFGDIIDTIFRLGRLLQVSEESLRKVSELEKRIQAVRERAKSIRPTKVFLQINIRPIMTVGRDTFHNDLIQTAGGINVFNDSSTPYPRISAEEVIKRQPDVIFISSMERDGQFEEAMREWSKWDSIPAVRNGRVYMIDSDLIDRPTPRAVLG